MLTQLIAGGLFLFFASQAPQKPVEDAGVLLERAAVAEKLGELTKARDLLAKAWSVADPAVKKAVEARQVELQKKLGGGEGQGKDASQSKPAQGEVLSSPLRQRFNGELQNYFAGSLKDTDMAEIAGLTGDDGLAILSLYLDDAPTASVNIVKVFSVAAMIAQRNTMSRAPLDFLVKYTKSNDAYIRKRAIMTISHLQLERAPWVTELASQFARDPDDESRALAVKLFAWNREAAKPFLAQLARDPSPRVRAAVVKYFASSLDPGDRTQLLRDKDPDVLDAILEAVRVEQWPDGGIALLALTQSDDPNVATRAAEVTFKKGFPGAKPEAVVPILTQMSRSPNISIRRQVGVRSRAIQELGALGIPIILARVNDEDETISKDATTVLDNVPADSRSRDYLAAACAAVKEVVARYPLDSKDRQGVNYGDNFVRGFGNYVTMTAKPEDLGLLLPVLTVFPDPGGRQQRTTQAILNLATDKNLTVLHGFLESCNDSDLRMEVLRRVLQIAKYTQGGVKVDLVPVLRTACKGDPNAQYTALAGMLDLGLGEMGLEILTLVDKVDVKNLDNLDFRALIRNAPEVATKALIRSIKRQEEAGLTNNLARDYQLVASSTGEKTSNVVIAFLLDDEFWNVATQRQGISVGTFVDMMAGNLGKLTPPAGADALKKIFTESTNSTVRSAAVRAMAVPKDPELTKFLVEKVLTCGHSYLPGVGVSVLAAQRAYDDDTVQHVAALLTDPVYSGLGNLSEYFTSWKNPKAIPYLRVLLKSSNPGIRKSTCNALGLFMSEDPVPDLLELLADSDKDVRATAKDALERIRFYNEEKRRWQEWNRAGGETPAEGLRKLLTALDDKDVDVRMAAAESLGTMKAKEALPRLVEKLKSTPAGAERDALAKAIAKLNQ